MEIKTEKVFHCLTCKKYSLHKHVIIQHEKTCKENPLHKHKCFEYCDHLEKTENGYHEDGEPIIAEFKCSVKDKFLKSYKVKRNKFLTEQTKELEFMPLACDRFFSSKVWED